MNEHPPTTPAADPPVNILLVDDEPRNLDVLESVLRSTSYNLVRAVSADEALLAVIQCEFAAIVLDVQMPGMTGIELARLIKQRRRSQHVPILFLTAYYQEDKDVLQGYGAGAVDYLTKPIEPAILKSKIDVFVELFRITRALARARDALELEIAQRLAAEEALRRVNNELEARVEQRTAELVQLNQELRGSEEALRKAKTELEAASKAKDEFLAALSHELRTPLNPALLLATEHERDSRLSGDVRGVFSSIRDSIELEARLIDDLLDLTRITHGKLALDQREVDVHTLLRSSWELLRPDATEKRLSVEFDLTAAGSWVKADSVRLQQVFWNLIQNAVRFTPEGGTIRLHTINAEAGWVCVHIADNGLGLAPDEVKDIFVPFNQGEYGQRFGGLGLGLAITRGLVELHNGRISVFSEGRGRGAAFVVALPGCPAPGAEATASTESRSREGPARPSRILLVEDHEPSRSILARLLVQRGHEVVTAASIQEARNQASTFTFDIVVSDLGLPDGSGHELMAELRRLRPACRGIALSGYGMQVDKDQSLQSGFTVHLTKPVDIHMLEDALRGAAP